MNAAYLLDTNIVSDLMRHPQGAVARCIAEVGVDRIAISTVVACELRFGVVRRRARRLASRLAEILKYLETLPLAPPTDRHYAEIRTALERAGTPIGPNDLLIAAHARALDMVLVTTNEREFTRVPGLKVENWLVPR